MTGDAERAGKLGSWLRTQREVLAMTREELAARSGLSVRTLADLERGRTSRPYPRSLRALAGALGLSGAAADDLVTSFRGGATLPEVSQLIADAEPEAASGATGVVPRQLPLAVASFAGREEELRALDALLASSGTGSPVVISAIGGTAGVGKTALAVHWAHQVAGQFRDGQLYLDLRGYDPAGPPVTSAEAIRVFLDGLQVPADRVPATAEGQAALYRSLLAGRRMLVVLDNARDEAQVRPLLPGSPTCFLLISSRSQLEGLAASHGVHLLSLDLLADGDALRLLSARLGEEKVRAEPEATTDLIRLCAGLPLALAIAASRAAAFPELALAAVAQELVDTPDRLGALDSGDAATSVRSVFSWSYQALSPGASRMFRLLGLHPGPGISAPAAASMAGIRLARAQATLRELERASLVTEHVAGRYTCHDLLRAYAAELARQSAPPGAVRAAVGRMLDHYLHTADAATELLYPHQDPVATTAPRRGVTPEQLATASQAMAWFEAERPVLTAATTLAADYRFPAHAWQIPWTLQTFLSWRGHWHAEVAVLRIALAAVSRGTDQSGLARIHRGLNLALSRQGLHDEAYTHSQAARDIYRQLDDPVGQAYTHMSDSWSFGRSDRTADALASARQALALFEAAGHRTGQAAALNHVGWNCAQAEDYHEGLACCLRAIELNREVGNRHGQANAHNSVGYIHYRLSDFPAAIGHLELALILVRELGDQYGLTESLNLLGDACQAAGQPDRARAAWQEAAGVMDAVHDPGVAQVRAKLAG